jgi:DNA-binding NarL/FixJ family response regulator
MRMPVLPIKLAVVGDDVLFRKMLTNFLSGHQRIDVVAQAEEAHELFPKLKTVQPDVLLMNLIVPAIDVCDTVEMMRKKFPCLRILILSMNLDMGLLSDLVEAGIHGYVPKTDDPETLLQAIFTAYEGRIYQNRLFTEALYWTRQNTIRTMAAAPQKSLTERERKILQLIWEERSNKEIADELFLGVRSIEKIRQDLKEKIGVRSTVGLIKFAIEQKIVKGFSRQVTLGN